MHLNYCILKFQLVKYILILKHCMPTPSLGGTILSHCTTHMHAGRVVDPCIHCMLTPSLEGTILSYCTTHTHAGRVVDPCIHCMLTPSLEGTILSYCTTHTHAGRVVDPCLPFRVPRLQHFLAYLGSWSNLLCHQCLHFS